MALLLRYHSGKQPVGAQPGDSWLSWHPGNQHDAPPMLSGSVASSWPTGAGCSPSNSSSVSSKTRIPDDNQQAEVIGPAAHTQVNLPLARKALVLLTNDGALPLAPGA